MADRPLGRGADRIWQLATSAVQPLALRVALAVAVLILAVHSGAAALLSALAGFLVARTIVLSRTQRAGP